MYVANSRPKPWDITMKSKNNSKTNITVLFQPNATSLSLEPNESVLEVAIKNKLGLTHSCDGNASCGTCRVLVLNGNPAPPQELEAQFISDRGWNSNERLACQWRPDSDIEVKIPKRNLD